MTTAIFPAILSYTIGIISVILLIPQIIKVANAKRLYDDFNERKIHKTKIPSLGGVAIFIGLTLGTIISSCYIEAENMSYIFASLTIVFFIGLKDDLVNISAIEKLIPEVIAAVILAGVGHFRFTNLHGIFGIYEIGTVWSYLITVFTFIVIMNAFNLIDGIDGLASGLAITSSTLLGVWFFMAGQFPFAVTSFALAGSLSGFFIFNVFGKKNKLFMGDSGSLVIGLIIAALLIKFNELNIAGNLPNSIKAAPSVSFAIIIIPLIDTLRVISIRISQKRSPFSADKNHIHHRVLYFFEKHLVVTLLLVSTNLLLFLFSLYLSQTNINVNLQLLIVIITSIAVSFIPSVLIKIDQKNRDKIATQGFRKTLLERNFYDFF